MYTKHFVFSVKDNYREIAEKIMKQLEPEHCNELNVLGLMQDQQWHRRLTKEQEIKFIKKIVRVIIDIKNEDKEGDLYHLPINNLLKGIIEEEF